MHKLVIVVILAAAIMIMPPRFRAIAHTDEPTAVFPSMVHDFGTVPQGSDVVHTFSLRNDGSATLQINRAMLTMPGMDIDLTPRIAPGETGEITLRWNTGQVAGPIEGEAIIFFNDPKKPQVKIVLKGIVSEPIDLLPLPVVFISVFNGDTKDRSVTVVNNQENPIIITGLEPDGEHFEAVVETVVPGKKYELRVTLPAGVPTGRYKEAVTLLTDDPVHPKLRVVVNLLVKPDPYINPLDVNFGQVGLGLLRKTSGMLEFLIQTFLISRRQGDMAITSVTTDVPFLDIQQDPPERGQIFRFDVGLDMDRIVPGVIDGTIIIKTDDPEYPELVIPVRGEITE